MADPFTTLDPYKRDQMVAYLNADESRIRIVKALERRAEPLSTDYLKELLWEKDMDKTLSVLTDMQKHGVVACLSYTDDKPATWDLTMEGREVLYALGSPPRASQWHLANILGNLLKKSKEAKQKAQEKASKDKDSK